jgi:hypothetical protein
MKLSLFLPALVFVAACGDAPEDRSALPLQQEPAAVPAATTGEQTGEQAAPAPAPAPPATKPGQSNAARDERAAARGAVTLAARADGENPDAALVEDFNARIAAYMKIHKAAAKGDAKPKETSDPAEITATREALAARITAARPAAKQGDIFTAEIRHLFRRLLAPELKGEDGRDAKATLKDDAPPAGAIKWKVNAKYPEGQPLPSVPANLLTKMPTLPEPLEYRIVDKHLLLLDTKSDLIVDYMWNAIR